MLGRLPKTSERVWCTKAAETLRESFEDREKRWHINLGTRGSSDSLPPTFRHWKATMEYARTKDILYVQRLLGHKSLKSTLRYTQLITLPQNEEYICEVAENVQGAEDLIEAGFEYVTDINGVKLFRKLKTSYLGSPLLL